MLTRSLALTILCSLTPALCRADAAREFPVDPVELVAGREAAGDPSHAVERGGYRYAFVSAESKRAFEADPARYEIQFGGSCARMGPLSGACSTQHYAAHEGKVYVFASKQCRATFVKDPARVLEGPDTAPAASPEALREGDELVRLAVRGVGGEEAIGALRTISYIAERTQTEGGKDYRVRNVFRARLPDSFRIEEWWNDSWWGHVLTADDAFAVASGSPSKGLVETQRDALARDVFRRTVALFAQRGKPGFVAVALPPASDNQPPTAEVAVSFRGATTTFTLDVESGRILAARRPSMGPDGFLTVATHTFDDFRAVGGLTLPHRIATAYASTPEKAPFVVDVTIEANAPLDDALFRR